VLPGHGRVNDRKDAGADDGADAQGGERPRTKRLFERLAGFFRLANQLVDGLARYQLAGQGSAPLYLNLFRGGGNLFNNIREYDGMIKEKCP
jgi:hypothetical protein